MAGHVDAAHQRVLAQDAAGACRRQRVLVVDGRVLDPHHDVARAEVVERELVEARDDAAVEVVDAVGGEGSHGAGVRG